MLQLETSNVDGNAQVTARAANKPSRLAASRSPVKTLNSRASLKLGLRDLWLHRELFYILTWRDVKVRYKQAALGVLWVILQPVLTVLIFTVLFGKLAKMPSDGEPYPIFSYAGLLPWSFFANSVTTGANSLVNNSNLVTKVYFPRLLIPGAAVGAAFIDLFIATIMLLVIMPIYGVQFHLCLLMFLPLTALAAVIAGAVSSFAAALNVKYRDIRHALPFLVQIGMFLTPVIYPPSLVPPHWRWLLMLNPLSAIVQGFRAATFNHAFDWTELGSAVLLITILTVGAAYYFRTVEREFADVI